MSPYSKKGLREPFGDCWCPPINQIFNYQTHDKKQWQHPPRVHSRILCQLGSETETTTDTVSAGISASSHNTLSAHHIHDLCTYFTTTITYVCTIELHFLFVCYYYLILILHFTNKSIHLLCRIPSNIWPNLFLTLLFVFYLKSTFSLLATT